MCAQSAGGGGRLQVYQVAARRNRCPCKPCTSTVTFHRLAGHNRGDGRGNPLPQGRPVGRSGGVARR
eukprot:5068537-Pyramimonas_sp.AAC.1